MNTTLIYDDLLLLCDLFVDLIEAIFPFLILIGVFMWVVMVIK